MPWPTSVDVAEQQLRPILARLGYRAFDFEILTDRPFRPPAGVPDRPLRFVVTRKSQGVTRTYDEPTAAAEFESDLVSGQYGSP
jgi:hypothetical protein